MENINLELLKYPIGKFIKPDVISKEYINKCISVIETFPLKLKKEVESLSENQLNTQYRPKGWTIRQVVNHCADSHINSLIRFKLVLTEEKPTIKPYFENLWAELPDSKLMNINASIKILEGIHEKWVVLLRSLSDEDLDKTFIHPEHDKEISLKTNIAIYAWHCEHHISHITSLKQRRNWL